MPAAAHAQAPSAGRGELIGSGLVSPPGWWGAIGRAGWLPDGDLGTAFPWTLAGTVAGAWSLEEPDLAPASVPAPGVVGAQGALAWYDSLTVVAGEGGAWDGYDAALARTRVGAELSRRPTEGWLPRADLVLATGSGGLNDHALGVWRGDSTGGLRLEAASGVRAPLGAIAGAGRDLYNVATVVVRGAHRVGAAFGHRRAQASLADGEAQEVRGESGRGSYRYARGPWSVGGSVVRGYDRHDSLSFGLPARRRLADQTATAVDLERASGRGTWGVRGSWSESRVSVARGAGRERARALWGAARWEGPLGGGRLEAAAGIGHHTRVDGPRFAPSLVWRFGPWDGRLMVERMITPVWTDLAAGQSAFVQDAWVGGLDTGMRAMSGGRARLMFLAGHMRNRALISRLPLETLALSAGVRVEPREYDFVLIMGTALWRARHGALGLEGFTLARGVSAYQPRVDPERGGRAYAEAEVTWFGGDLRVRPRGDVYWIGPRESEANPSRGLPGYVTFAAGLQVSLADAVVLIEGRNLEDRARPFTWVDGVTGREALGPKRELRATLTWRLWN